MWSRWGWRWRQLASWRVEGGSRRRTPSRSGSGSGARSSSRSGSGSRSGFFPSPARSEAQRRFGGGGAFGLLPLLRARSAGGGSRRELHEIGFAFARSRLHRTRPPASFLFGSAGGRSASLATTRVAVAFGVGGRDRGSGRGRRRVRARGRVRSSSPPPRGAKRSAGGGSRRGLHEIGFALSSALGCAALVRSHRSFSAPWPGGPLTG